MTKGTTSGLLTGVFGSTADRLGADTRMECGVCWSVYDPAAGCDTWDVAPGTAFAALPDHWRCPTCDNDKSVFLPLDPPAADPMAARVAALEETFRKAEEAFVDTPFHNPALKVEAVGFRPWGKTWLGILVTPWFMNVILLPQEAAAWDGLVPGAVKQRHVLPAGDYDFEVGRLDGFGTWQACSLFSPMDSFGTHETARLTAEACLDALFTAEEPSPRPAPEPAPEAAPEADAIDRRALLRGQFGSKR